ncbi:hypothetical protein ACFQAT_28630 [Undibacterium arcticum]|uniref:Uncharacterized protein n=1 Tax=Undibacterium arcticum TaxID=1762892 RepID=A0ABV7F746_9BURK
MAFIDPKPTPIKVHPVSHDRAAWARRVNGAWFVIVECVDGNTNRKPCDGESAAKSAARTFVTIYPSVFEKLNVA